MSEPQIARRCPSCGASIRDAASFCPQCGKKLASQNREQSQHGHSALTAPLLSAPEITQSTHAESSSPVSDHSSTVTESAKSSATVSDSPSTVTEPANNRPKDLPQSELKTEKAAAPKKAPAGQAAVGKMRGGIKRATNLARDVEGEVSHRVQKARHISSVVLDEAGYDPSLRFVLVACALFVVFLIIMLLNKLIS